jgi:peptidoglycan/LPS O-acetylase OafA/YrhL
MAKRGHGKKQWLDRRPTAYILGMRGVAAFFVLVEHFSRPFYPSVFQDYRPSLVQLPGVRLIYSGHVMVQIFFVISGFSLSIQPLQMIYKGDLALLHQTLASVTFRRGIRLLLPPMAVSFLVMIGVQLHLFDASVPIVEEMGYTPPRYRETLWEQLCSLVEYILSKLVYPSGWAKPVPNVTTDNYVPAFWTIPRELWASILLLATITGLSMVRPIIRMFAVGHFALFAAWVNRTDVECFFAGMMIAELHVWRSLKPVISQPSRGWQFTGDCWWTCMLLVGVWMASVPLAANAHGSTVPGFRIISAVMPSNYNVFTAGAILIVLAISRLPVVQSAFSLAPLQYLGQISFGLYLVHWPLLAAGGWQMVPLMRNLTGNGSTGARCGFILAFPLVTVPVLWAADLVWRFVDLPSIRLAKRLEKQFFLF